MSRRAHSAASSSSSSSSSGQNSGSVTNPFSALEGIESDGEIQEALSPPPRAPRKVRNPLVWIDLEMTGLEPEEHTIIEIAALVTDGNLGVKHIGPSLVIHQSEDVIANMNDWSKEHHQASGLTEKVRQSTTTMEEAEEEVLDFVRKHTEPGVAQLAGNSVYTDMNFLKKYMPRLTAHLSYKIVDVSTVKELARRWFPNEFRRRPRKKLAHTAMSDIEESLEELKFYKQKVFKRTKGRQ